MGVCMMGRSVLILALCAVFCGRALCTSEVRGDMRQDNPVMCTCYVLPVAVTLLCHCECI